jgi:hypothetical protein
LIALDQGYEEHKYKNMKELTNKKHDKGERSKTTIGRCIFR